MSAAANGSMLTGKGAISYVETITGKIRRNAALIRSNTVRIIQNRSNSIFQDGVPAKREPPENIRFKILSTFTRSRLECVLLAESPSNVRANRNIRLIISCL